MSNKINERRIIVATDENIRSVVFNEIRKYGFHADLNHIDVSQVTDMNHLFSDYSDGQYEDKELMNLVLPRFNGDISKWNVSNVEDMGFMFVGSMFNGDISNWDTSNVEVMDLMFSYSSFNGDVSKWNISKVRYGRGSDYVELQHQ